MKDRKVHYTTDTPQFGRDRHATCSVHTTDNNARLTAIKGAVTCEACKKTLLFLRNGSQGGPVIVEK